MKTPKSIKSSSSASCVGGWKVAVIALAILVFSLVMMIMLNKAKEGFVSAAPPYKEFNPMSVSDEAYGTPFNSLKFECSKTCCELGKMSSMSCNSGCVCKSDYNTNLLSTRGGNNNNGTDI